MTTNEGLYSQEEWLEKASHAIFMLADLLANACNKKQCVYSKVEYKCPFVSEGRECESISMFDWRKFSLEEGSKYLRGWHFIQDRRFSALRSIIQDDRLSLEEKLAAVSTKEDVTKK